MPDEPYYDPHREKCIYLGQFWEDPGTDNTIDYDLFYCPQFQGLATVIARYGEDEPDFIFCSDHPAVVEGERLAKEKGLI